MTGVSIIMGKKTTHNLGPTKTEVNLPLTSMPKPRRFTSSLQFQPRAQKQILLRNLDRCSEHQLP